MHEKTMTPGSCLRWKLTGKIFKTIGLRWVPTGKIFTSSTTKVDSEPTNRSDEDITNQYEYEQTLDVSAGTLNLSAAMTSDHNSSELGIHNHSNEPSSSKLVPKVVPLADKTTTSRQELELLFHNHITMLRSTYNSLETKLRGRLLESFQDDAKYEHVGQDTRSQGGKDDQDKQGKDLEISKSKTKSKDNDKGSRSKITKHEGTRLQQDKDQDKDKSLMTKAISFDLMKECHNELTSGKIVSLKILSRTKKFVH
ncbi:hypothetical protein Tco_0374668 [Tanacetum coccineum]